MVPGEVDAKSRSHGGAGFQAPLAILGWWLGAQAMEWFDTVMFWLLSSQSLVLPAVVIFLVALGWAVYLTVSASRRSDSY